jgi:hypothetical protein
MTNTPEKFLISFEMPAIFTIGALLIAAAAVSEHGPWQTATTAVFAASVAAVSFALAAAVRYCHRWP